MTLISNKHNLIIIGDADAIEVDEYAQKQAMRDLKRLDSLFGIIDSKLESCKNKEGVWYLQNIIINILRRLNLGEKQKFIDGMSSMYDLIESEKKRVEKPKGG